MASEGDRRPRLDPRKHSARDLFLLLGLQLGWFDDTYSNIISKLTQEIEGKYENSLLQELIISENDESRTKHGSFDLALETRSAQLLTCIGTGYNYLTCPNSDCDKNSSKLTEINTSFEEASADIECKEFENQSSSGSEDNFEMGRPSESCRLEANDNYKHKSDIRHSGDLTNHKSVYYDNSLESEQLEYEQPTSGLDDFIDDNNHLHGPEEMASVRPTSGLDDFIVDDNNHSHGPEKLADIKSISDLTNNASDGSLHNHSLGSEQLKDVRPRSGLTSNISEDYLMHGTQECVMVIQDDSPVKKLTFTPNDKGSSHDENGIDPTAKNPALKGSLLYDVSKLEDLSPPRLSLREKLLQKYNPENSTGSCNELKIFQNRAGTPKNVSDYSKVMGTETTIKRNLVDFILDESDSDDVFLVEDDSDEDDFDDDFEKENKVVPRQATTKLKPVKKQQLLPVQRVLNREGLESSSSGQVTPDCIPRSSLNSVITPYSTQKEFKKGRDNLVSELFRVYNSTVFEGKLPDDFKITWNKKLRSTAGFCYYGRKNGVNTARIELSDKVIDSADRLRDTLIHEMCHAAAWVISGIKAGHGPIWKSWAARASFVHQDLPSISRCHSYTINTKYNYRCTICGHTFGRHSKSVKLDIHRCGYCKGRLELLPQLKKDGTPAKTRAPNKFAAYVKASYSSVKKANNQLSHGEVMSVLSTQFAALSTANPT